MYNLLVLYFINKVLSLMLPLRYDFIKFGGSWAQRQVFELTVIMVTETDRKT